MRGDEIRFTPCLPSHWEQAELTLRRDDRSLRVIFCRGPCELAAVDAAFELAHGTSLRWSELGAHGTCFVRLDTIAGTAAAAASASASPVH